MLTVSLLIVITRGQFQMRMAEHSTEAFSVMVQLLIVLSLLTTDKLSMSSYM